MNVDPLSTTRGKVGLNEREDIRATWWKGLKVVTIWL